MILTKIKLINWHLFTNETITLKGNTLLSGENGTGKSTLVDALYYLLSGGDDKHFNHAANQNAKRTLETYMRCKTGVENKEYLRNEANLISHIAVEYYSPKTSESFVLGVVLELQKGNSKPKPYFYFIDRYQINEEDYISNNIISNYNTLKKNIKNLESLETNGVKKRREAIARDIFKLESSDKYFDLLAKAIAFKPIEEVNSFVNSFLLSEKNIDLETLRLDMRNYKEIHESLVREENKINCLNEFIDNTIKYETNRVDIEYLYALLEKANIQNLNNKINKNKDLISSIKLEVSQNTNKKNDLNSNITEVNKEIALLEANEIFKALNIKKDKLSKDEEKYKEVLSKISYYDDLVRKEDIVRKKISSKNIFLNSYLAKDYIKFISEVKSYSEELDSARDSIQELRVETKYKIKENEDKIKELVNKLNSIKKGIKPYDNNFTTLKETVEKAIKLETGKDITVKPLCEYLEIKEEKQDWANAIEAYLNTQRFDLIVEPKYFNIAVKTYEEIKSHTNIYGIGIVDVAKINDVETNEASVFNALEINNNYALRYAKFLLNNVICAESIEDLNKHKISITRTCMLYKNYSARALNKKLYESPYIGRDALRRQEERLNSELEEINKVQSKLREEYNRCDEAIQILSKSKVDTIKEMDNFWSSESTLKDNILRLKEEIKHDEASHDLLELSNQINEKKDRVKALHSEVSSLEHSINELTRREGSLESDIKQYTNSLEISENNYNRYITLIKADESKYLVYLNKEKEYSHNDSLSYTRISDDLRSKEASNNQMRTGIIRGMQKYSNSYRSELVAQIENAEDFINEYYRIKNNNVTEYTERSKQAFEKCEDGFRSVFLSGLRSNILEAQEQIKKLNKSLDKHPFGRDKEKYQFVFKASNDLEDYYRIIMSGDEITGKDLFTETLNEKDSAIILNLFNKIADSDESRETESYLARYLDYRSYMNYDIKVTNDKEEVSFISKTSREKSGGETQTPFYVVIAACFDELMKKSEEACCLVIFDEAFNNMDEGRISDVLEYYKELSIQLFIVVPGVRTYSIAPYMDSVIGIAKSANRLVLFHESGK